MSCFDFPQKHFFTLPYRVWSSIVIVHEKRVFFLAPFFRNISKTTETILIKKIGRTQGISVYKKALISGHQKNYIFRNNNCFVKMSVSLLVSKLVSQLVSLYVTNFCGRASSKTSMTIKTKFPTQFGALRLRADQILVHIDPKLRGGVKI